MMVKQVKLYHLAGQRAYLVLASKQRVAPQVMEPRIEIVQSDITRQPDVDKLYRATGSSFRAHSSHYGSPTSIETPHPGESFVFKRLAGSRGREQSRAFCV